MLFSFWYLQDTKYQFGCVKKVTFVASMLTAKIFNISSKSNFKKVALDVFRFQAKNNAVYAQFLKHLHVSVEKVQQLEEIPFLPIQFFKSHKVVASKKKIQEVFLSSGTTGNKTSKHYVVEPALYQKSYTKGFESFFGSVKDFAILALLPNYLERKGSSLVYMMQDLIHQSQNTASGFFLNNEAELAKKLQKLDKNGQKTLLIGVSYALLDLIEKQKFDLKNTIVMETGGMKGRRKEMIREELHTVLCNGFGVEKIYSEYGMTELLSQAYSKGDGLFTTPPWMKILIRDTEDALTIQPNGTSGAINVIDLANINSCSFIATDDLGKLYQNNTFEILGRFDHADIRGCNLLLIK